MQGTANSNCPYFREGLESTVDILYDCLYHKSIFEKKCKADFDEIIWFELAES